MTEHCEGIFEALKIETQVFEKISAALQKELHRDFENCRMLGVVA